jgi:hypothetical protein
MGATHKTLGGAQSPPPPPPPTHTHTHSTTTTSLFIYSISKLSWSEQTGYVYLWGAAGLTQVLGLSCVPCMILWCLLTFTRAHTHTHTRTHTHAHACAHTHTYTHTSHTHTHITHTHTHTHTHHTHTPTTHRRKQNIGTSTATHSAACSQILRTCGSKKTQLQAKGPRGPQLPSLRVPATRSPAFVRLQVARSQ